MIEHANHYNMRAELYHCLHFNFVCKERREMYIFKKEVKLKMIS